MRERAIRTNRQGDLLWLEYSLDVEGGVVEVRGEWIDFDDDAFEVIMDLLKTHDSIYVTLNYRRDGQCHEKATLKPQEEKE